jgi:predicted metal-binding protein
MSTNVINENGQELRTYPGPWKGEAVLVCGKCQKKLKHDDGNKKLAKIGKTLRKRAEKRRGLKIHSIEVGCLKMCPKGGVTACTGVQLARKECSILRSVADVDAFIERCADGV